MNTSLEFKRRSQPQKLKVSVPRHRPGGHFLKGPIAWDWLCVAANQSGKALHVAIALWFLVCVK